MSTDEKVLKILDELQKGQKTLEAGQKSLQDDVTEVKAETGKLFID